MFAQLVLFATVVTCVLTNAAVADSDLKSTLLEQETKLVDAIKNQDRETYRAMLHDETMAVLAGTRLDASQISKSLERRRITSYTISAAKALPLDVNVAILTYKYVWTGGEVGGPMKEQSAYATSIWAKHNGEWKSFFYQETPIGE